MMLDPKGAGNNASRRNRLERFGDEARDDRPLPGRMPSREDIAIRIGVKTITPAGKGALHRARFPVNNRKRLDVRKHQGLLHDRVTAGFMQPGLQVGS
jgi:hypothetical protein